MHMYGSKVISVHERDTAIAFRNVTLYIHTRPQSEHMAVSVLLRTKWGTRDKQLFREFVSLAHEVKWRSSLAHDGTDNEYERSKVTNSGLSPSM